MSSLFFILMIVVAIALVGAVIAIWTNDLEEEHKEEVEVGEHLRSQKKALDASLPDNPKDLL